MKILSLYVENFGTLQQFSLSLTDGKNTLLRPNGWGKSSLAVFIKAMLYGLPTSSRRSLVENERKRYTPWQGGTFGGSMDVEIASRRLRIERTFGAKESEDTLTLTDLDTGVELPLDANVTLGETWFGVDAAAYERSTYISQRPTDESDGNLSIHAKLNRLADATDDIAGYDHAIGLLEKQRKYYTVSGGRRGAIADDEEALAQLQTQMEVCRSHLAAAGDEEAQLELLLQSLQACKKESAELLLREEENRARGEREVKVQSWQRMQAQLEQSETERAALLASLGGRLPDEQTIQTIACEELETAAARSLEQQLMSRCAPEHPQSVELAELAALFDDDAPDDVDISQLRTVAESAKSAKLQLQSEAAKEKTLLGTPDAQEQVLPFPDARRLQRFLTQYPMQKQQSDGRARELERACREGAQRVTQLQIRREKKKKCIWAVAAIGLVLGIVALLVQPLVGAAVLAVGVCAAIVCVALWRREVAKCRDAQDALESVMQERKEHQDEAAGLQREWQAACDRIREVLGVTVDDVEAAQNALDDYEAHRAQAQAQKRERESVREAWYDRLYELRQAAEKEQAFLRQLWAWGVCPDVEDAPVEVERLSQKAARYAQLQEELAATVQQLTSVRGRLQTLREQRELLLQGCADVPSTGAATWLRERREQVLRLQKSCEQQKAEIQEFMQQNGIDATALHEVDAQTRAQEADMLREQRDALTAREETLHGQIARCRREIEMHTAEGAPLELLEHQADELRAKLDEQRASLDTILSAQKYLKEAKEKFSGRYLERMKTGFARYLSRLCGEENISATMDGNFSVKLRRAGVSRTPEAMSTGWRDMISLCARLSLVDALFEGEAPFLVLDDPLVNLDDEAAARAALILDEAAAHYQILYLTCHSSRA